MGHHLHCYSETIIIPTGGVKYWSLHHFSFAGCNFWQRYSTWWWYRWCNAHVTVRLSWCSCERSLLVRGYQQSMVDRWWRRWGGKLVHFLLNISVCVYGQCNGKLLTHSPFSPASSLVSSPLSTSEDCRSNERYASLSDTAGGTLLWSPFWPTKLLTLGPFFQVNDTNSPPEDEEDVVVSSCLLFADQLCSTPQLASSSFCSTPFLSPSSTLNAVATLSSDWPHWNTSLACSTSRDQTSFHGVLRPSLNETNQLSTSYG